MINQTDTSQTVYDIRQELYWDSDSLDSELTRVYDICTGCRLCFNLCPSFPSLFNALDDQGDALRQVAIASGEHEDVAEKSEYLNLPEGEQQAAASAEATFIGSPENLSHDQKWEVVDLCYQCKLCEQICPYTPEKEHDFQLDFPRLMLRSQAVRTKQRGIKMNDRVLANPDAVGKVGSLTAPMSNWGNHLAPVRFMLEKMAGISRRRDLPRFHRLTFAKWFKKHRRQHPQVDSPVGKVVIFATCYTNANDSGLGKTAVEILEHNNVGVQLARQRCCGAPYLSPGDFDGFTTRWTHI